MSQTVYCVVCDVEAPWSDVPDYEGRSWRFDHSGHTQILTFQEDDVDVQAARDFLNAPTEAEHQQGWRASYPQAWDWGNVEYGGATEPEPMFLTLLEDVS